MSDRVAFYRAIEESPEDDTPRLVFADWLDENGEPERAEFIRVQCELARGPDDVGRWKQLAARERELLRRCRKAWAGALPVAFSRGLSYHRGFPDPLDLTSKTFLQVHEALAAATPIHNLALRLYGASVASLAACRTLRWVRYLDLSRQFGTALSPTRSRGFFRSPYLNNLRRLDISGSTLGLSGAQSLADADLPRLRTLILGATRFHRDGFSYFFESPSAARLSYLDLSRFRYWDGLDRLGEYETLTGLRVLCLEDCYSECVHHLAGSQRFVNLTALNIGSITWQLRRHDTLLALGASSGLPNLSDLSLARCHINLTGEEERWYSYSGVSDRGFPEFLRTPMAARLTRLNLGENPLGLPGAELLAGAGLRSLETLGLSVCSLTDAAVVALAASPDLANLETLDVSGNPLLGDTAATAVLRSTHLADLRELRFDLGGISKPIRAALEDRFGPGLNLPE